MPLLVDLARQILRHAEDLEKQLEDANVPQPTFDVGSSPLYPKPTEYPDMYHTRTSLVDASKSLFELALGPVDMIRTIVGPERMNIELFKVLLHFRIANRVPQNGSITFGDLALKAGVSAEVLERVMRLAFSIHVFKEDPIGSVCHTSISQAIPMMSPWIWLQCREGLGKAVASWSKSMQVYEEQPKPGQRTRPWQIGNDSDVSFFDGLIAEEGGMKNFSDAMKCITSITGNDKAYIWNGFDWAGLENGPVVDVGGGNGHVSVTIAEGFPKLQFIIQDLPFNEKPAADTIPGDMKDRVTFQAHNFFEAQPPDLQVKAFFLKAVLHDWPDHDCVRILSHLLPKVEQGARIFIMDRITPAPGKKPTHYESFVIFIDLEMYSQLGAKERSLEQWKSLLAKTDPRLRIVKWQHPVGCEFGFIEVGY